MDTIDTIQAECGRAPRSQAHLQPGGGTASHWSVIRMVSAVVQWRVERWRSRRALEELDAHALRDIGLTQEAALREARRPFWD